MSFPRAFISFAIFASFAVLAQAQIARLSASQVVKLARAELKKHNIATAEFVADSPKYDATSHRWYVFFRQRRVPPIIDGDNSVYVNDLTGKACLYIGISPQCA